MLIVEQLIEEVVFDVICFQEIKCLDVNFLEKVFCVVGYEYMVINGQQGYYGVVILLKLLLDNIEKWDFCNVGDSCYVVVDVFFNGFSLCVYNFYVFVGGDELDCEKNDKFGYKFDFLGEMQDWL